MRDQLFRFIRRAPRSTQACRDELDCSSIETEGLLEELRDEGEIAFANGTWYVPDSSRLQRRRPATQSDPRQLGFKF